MPRRIEFCYTDEMSLNPRQIEQAGAVLAQAFHQNPAFSALLRDDAPAERLPLCGPMLTTSGRPVSLYGEVDLTESEGTVKAVALMFRPGKYPEPLRFQW